MTLKHFVFSATAGFFLLSSSLVDARSLMPISEWNVKKVKGVNPYCTLAREYEGSINFTVAKNQKNEGTIAIGFASDVLERARAYPILLSVGNVVRQYSLKPASSRLLIMRVGQDHGLYDAMSGADYIQIKIDNETFSVGLDGYSSSPNNIDRCLGNEPKIAEKQPMTVLSEPVSIVEANNQDKKIDALLDESKALSNKIDDVIVSKKIQKAPSKSVATASKSYHEKLKKELLQAKVTIAELEMSLEEARKSINPDMSSVILEKSRKIAELMGQNQALREKLEILETREPKVVIKEVEVPTIPVEITTENQELKKALKTLQVELANALDDRDQMQMRLGEVTTPETIVKEVEVIKEIIKEVPSDSSELLDQNAMMTKLVAELENKLMAYSVERSLWEEEMARLTRQVSGKEPVIKEIIKEVPVETISPEMQAENNQLRNDLQKAQSQLNVAIAEREKIQSLLNKKAEPKTIIKEVEVVKEVVKEIPVFVNGDNGQLNNISDGNVIAQLEELEAEADAYQAERDEYRRLLQEERNRVRKSVRGEMTDDELSQLNAKLADVQMQLEKSKSDKDRLMMRMKLVDAESARLQRQLVEDKIADLANDTPEAIQKELEQKTLRSELAALEAQNDILRSDAVSKRQERIESVDVKDVTTKGRRVADPLSSANKTDKIVTSGIKWNDKSSGKEAPKMAARPVAKVVSEPVDFISMSPTKKQMASPQVIALSGDEIRQLVSQSKIPLMSSIDRIDRVSGPDFAAFTWDTGVVYGSGEQSRLNDVSAFNKSVQNYIQKTASRCQGSFDQDVSSIDTMNDLIVKKADIACVDNNANGSAASIIFFARDGMFYALAHEADMNSFKVAMDMRDRLVGSIDQVF